MRGLGLIFFGFGLCALGGAAEVIDLGKFPMPGYPYTNPMAMSDDGRVAGGWASDATAGKVSNRGWIWTAARGMQPLQHRKDVKATYVYAVSADGRYFAGGAWVKDISCAIYGSTERPNDYIVFKDAIDSPYMKLSADGSMLVAPSKRKGGFGLTIFNMKSPSRQDLPMPNVNGSYGAMAISSDASRIISWVGGRQDYFYWRKDKPLTMRQLIPPGLSDRMTIHALSGDGLVAAGEGNFNAYAKSFLWSEAKGYRFLPQTELQLSLLPSALNKDGTVLATHGGLTGNLPSYVWTEKLGIRKMQSLLRPSEMPSAKGWFIYETVAMGSGGYTFLVCASVPDPVIGLEHHGYIVRFNSLEEMLAR